MRILNSHNLLKQQRGFTLVEMMVVIAIIALILSVAVVNYSAANIRNRDGKRMADIEQIRSALEMYRADNPTLGYPVLDTLVASNYLKAVPPDPLSSQGYNYYYSTGGSTYSICAKLEGTVPSGMGCPVVATCKNLGDCNYGQRQP